MEAFINKIIPCSFVDGPGCRTAIFMQGCNMRCVFCHNPETQFICNDCGLCVEGCPSAALVLREGKVSFDEEKCIDCQRCITICAHHSSPKVRSYGAGELFSLIEKDQDFIEGITFSGGECTLNPEFIIAFANLLHQKTNLSVFLDTNGLMPTPVLEDLIACSEGLLFDLKAFSNEIHQQLTGTDNGLIKHNIGLAARAGKLYEVRFMLMDGINDSEAELNAYFNYISGLPGKTRLKLIPFSPFGVRGAYQDTPAYPRDKYNAVSALGQGILKDRLVKVCYN